MTTEGRTHPAHDEGLTPFLFWNEIITGGGGAPLACPQCAGANLHLDTIQFAVPTEDHYTPTVGLTIDPDNGTTTDGDQARQLHAGQNRGSMLAIGFWCENFCRGRIELRSHKGHLYASLHREPACEPWETEGPETAYVSADKLNGRPWPPAG
jgi:hypothetical protein